MGMGLGACVVMLLTRTVAYKADIVSSRPIPQTDDRYSGLGHNSSRWTSATQSGKSEQKGHYIIIVQVLPVCVIGNIVIAHFMRLTCLYS